MVVDIQFPSLSLNAVSQRTLSSLPIVSAEHAAAVQTRAMQYYNKRHSPPPKRSNGETTTEYTQAEIVEQIRRATTLDLRFARYLLQEGRISAALEVLESRVLRTHPGNVEAMELVEELKPEHETIAAARLTRETRSM